ncbi:hypothetical protein U750_07075 [Streptococcus pseudopneumoniae G42]|nr:hypothetical protein U750_07075 [Streptococcus pseudopneumoniae G42]
MKICEMKKDKAFFEPYLFYFILNENQRAN